MRDKYLESLPTFNSIYEKLVKDDMWKSFKRNLIQDIVNREEKVVSKRNSSSLLSLNLFFNIEIDIRLATEGKNTLPNKVFQWKNKL